MDYHNMPNQYPNNSSYYDYQKPDDDGSRSEGMATAALVLGICAIVFACCGGSIFFGALGIIMALLSRGSSRMSGNAKIGLGLSIGGFSVCLVFMVVSTFSFLSTPDGQKFFSVMERTMNGELNFDSQEEMQDYLYDYFYNNDSSSDSHNNSTDGYDDYDYNDDFFDDFNNGNDVFDGGEDYYPQYRDHEL